MRTASAGIVAALLFSGSWTASAFDARVQRSRSLNCDSAFRATDDVAALAERYGTSAVAAGDIHLGEGFYEIGTILFGESALDRIEILWSDKAALRHPRTMRICGSQSNWRTPVGLALGQRLQQVEALNRKPFRLAGFGWDYGGTQLSWAKGRLESPTAGPCSTRVRFREVPGSDSRELSGRVRGDGAFSSGHPAMQALNPEVYEIWLEFKSLR